MQPPPSEPTFTVFAKKFSNGEQNQRVVGQFLSYEAALTVAAKRVRNTLVALYNTEQSAKELFELWMVEGDNIIIVPDDDITPFSATDFSRLMALQVTRDDSRPLYLEVTCIDQLNFSSGFSSPPKQWVFWVKAPATYSGAAPLIWRATEVLYREMSQKAYQSGGSSYTLLEMTMRELSEAEVMQPPPRRTVLTVQGNGAFVNESS